MNKQLFTALEIAVIGVLILVVLYWGGVFEPRPDPTPVPASLTPTITPDKSTAVPSGTPAASRTPRPTLVPSITPTNPALVQPTGLIAFETTRDGNSEIYTVNPDGSEQTNITNNLAEDYNFTWSPDGSRIAFFSTRTGWLEVFTMDADGTNVKQITRTELGRIVYSPPLVWSPDGRYILSRTMPMWLSPHTEAIQSLNVIYSDGSGGPVALYRAPNGYLWQPSWSPDNHHISIAVQDDQTCRTYMVDMEDIGDSPMEFRPLIPACGSFAWSPDGSLIAYPRGSAGIKIITLDGVEQYTLQISAHEYGVMNASPDWQYFLYTNMSGLVNAVSIHGTRLVQLSLPQDSAINWSPDGQWITFVDRHQLDIRILNIYDPTRSVLITRTNDSYAPQWQPRP